MLTATGSSSNGDSSPFPTDGGVSPVGASGPAGGKGLIPAGLSVGTGRFGSAASSSSGPKKFPLVSSLPMVGLSVGVLGGPFPSGGVAKIRSSG